MRHCRRLFAKLNNLFRSGRADRELDREVSAHLTLLEDEFQSRGMSLDEARIEARRAYGGVEQAKQLQREERSIRWLEQTFADLRFACRSLLKTPGFTTVAVLTLALAAHVPIAGAMQLANFAAGAVVEKLGTATASAAEIVALMEHDRDA